MTTGYKTPEAVIASYGTSLEETRKMVKELEQAVKLKQQYPFLPAPVFLAQDELAEYGIELPEPMPEGWLLKISPVEGKKPEISFLTADKWEIIGEDTFISPEGEKFTKAELEALMPPEVPLEELGVAEDYDTQIRKAMEEAYPTWSFPATMTAEQMIEWHKAQQAKAEEVKAPFEALFPGEAENIIYWLDDQLKNYETGGEENINNFVGLLQRIGKTPETEAVLKQLGASEEEINEIFLPGEYEKLPGIGKRIFNVAYAFSQAEGWHKALAPLAAFPEVTGLMEKVGAAWEKYVNRPWLSLHLMGVLSHPETEVEWEALAIMQEAQEKYGWASIFSPEVSQVWNMIYQDQAMWPELGPTGEVIQPGKFVLTAQKYTNPVYWYPIGKGIGAAANAFKGVPVVGRHAIRVAAAVQKAEATLAWPLNKAIQKAYLKTFTPVVKRELYKWGATKGIVKFDPMVEDFAIKVALRYVSPGKLTKTAIRQMFQRRGLEYIATYAGETAASEAGANVARFVPLLGAGGMAARGATEETTTAIVLASARIIELNIMREMITASFIASFVPEGVTLEKTVSLIEQLKDMGHSAEAIDAMSAEEAWANLFREVAPEPVVEPVTPPKVDISGISDSGAREIVEGAENLFIDLPSQEAILKAALEPNWQRDLAQKIASIAGGEKLINVVDPRLLANLEFKNVSDIIKLYAIDWHTVTKMGSDIRAVKMNELQGITTRPVKMFGFNDNAISNKMIKRLLPQHKGLEEAGTLEHVFTKPEMYDWTGFRKGLDYVTRAHETNTELTRFAISQGVGPEGMEEVGNRWWMHRVVEGRYDANGELIAVRGRPGMKGKWAKLPSYGMHRKAASMWEGMTWRVKYGENPETSVGTYIEEVFNQIAKKRYYEGVDKALEAIGKEGITPADMLKQRFPEIVDKAELNKRQLADTGKFHALVSRAIRGEKIPGQTLTAIEKRFPDLGRQFRGLVEEAPNEIKQLRELLAESQKTINQLQKLLKAKEIKPEIVKPQALPDEQKLAEAFKVMSYEDRLAFRSTMDNQLEELARVIYEHESELAGIREFLKTDPVATYHGIVKGKKVPLTAVLVKGGFPETFSVEEAKMLMMGRAPKTIIKGRVPRSVVVDELADHFKMTEQELIDQIESIRVQRETANDLVKLIRLVDGRLKDIKLMLEIMNSVDVKPEFIPKAEPGMPEAGLQEDMFGYTHPVFPAGKGEVTQISMDEYNRLIELRKAAGLEGPPPNVAVRPPVEGIKGLEPEGQIAKVIYKLPDLKGVAERKELLNQLRAEVKALMEARKAPYWQARFELAAKMEPLMGMTPEIGKGRLVMSHWGGKIYDQDVIDAVNQFFGGDKGSRILKPIANFASIMRLCKATLDLSFHAIQGQPAFGLAFSYMLTNPKIGTRMMAEWFKGQVYAASAFLEPGIMHRYLDKHGVAGLQRVSFGGSSSAIDYFEAMKGKGLTARALNKFPPFKRAELAFYGAGELMRNTAWEALSEEAIRNGTEFELAAFLDRMTGIISTQAMGVTPTIRQLESAFIWFAPRYTRACLTMIGNCFRGGYTGAKARRAMAGMIAGAILIYSGTQYAISTLEGKDSEEAWNDVLAGFGVEQDPITGEWDWKPSARLMTLKIGNYYFGIGGFWYGMVRLFGNIMATVNEVGDKEIIDLARILKYGSLNRRDNPFIAWWYNRASPFTGFMFEAGWPLMKSVFSGELQSGSDFLGFPIESPWDYSRYLITRFEPIWMEQGLNPYIPFFARDQEIPEGVARIAVPIIEIFGLRSFPESSWVIFYDKVNETLSNIPEDLLAEYFTEEEMVKILQVQKDGKLRWAHLPKPLQLRLLSMYPELMELYEQAQADWQVRASPQWKQWEARINEEKTIYYARGNDLFGRVRDGELDTRELREMWSDAGRNYGTMLDAIAKEPAYQDIYAFFDKREAQGVKYDWYITLALMEYQDIMFAEYIDEKGDLDWDAKDRAVAGYIEKWGEEAYEIIRRMYSEKKLLAGLDPALVRLAEDKEKLGREYWQLPYRPIYKMDEDDEAKADIPAEFYALWKEYQALETDAEREAFLKAHPALEKDWRAEYRLAHPESDAMLALWGYGGKLQTREAYDLVTKWGEELGIPLEQMGLGLPPVNLIDYYFDLNKIVAETSGNSVEARLYKLQHPSYLSWGLEQGIWTDDLSDEHLESLQLRVKFKDDFDKYDSIIFDNATQQREARDRYLKEHPDFAEARRRVEAYSLDFPEGMISQYVKYYSLPEKGDWRARYRLENPDFDKTMMEIQDLMPLEPDKVRPEQYDQIYLDWEELFEAYDSVTGTATERKEARQEILKKNPAFAKARLCRKAYEIYVPDKYVELYVDYYSLPEAGWDRERLLKEHQDYYHEVWIGLLENDKIDFEKIPSEKMEMMLDKYFNLPSGSPRLQLRCKSEELDAWLVKVYGYKPCYGTYRCGVGVKPEAEEEPSFMEQVAEAQAIKDWLERQWK